MILFKDGKLPVIYQKGKKVINFRYVKNVKELINELNSKNWVDCDNDAVLIYVKEGVNAFNQKINFDRLVYESIYTFSGIKQLIPVITQDENGVVLMTAYMSRETIKDSLNNGLMTYYSRNRGYWVKGRTSGCTQEIKSIVSNNDNNCLLAIVKQNGFACHTGNYSCFYKKLKASDSL